MSDFRDVTFGEHLFSRIDDNAYLQKLYHNILINYSKRLFRLDEMEDQPVNIGDALTFADVLSKSCGTNLSDIHKTRAQEMVALLYDMYPQDTQVKYYLGSVLANTGNFLGMNRHRILKMPLCWSVYLCTSTWITCLCRPMAKHVSFLRRKRYMIACQDRTSVTLRLHLWESPS